MSNPFDAIAGPIKQLHAQAGWPGTVYNYSPDTGSTADWYEETADSEFVEDAGAQVTIRVEGNNAGDESVVDESGREVQGEVKITVDPDEAQFTAGEGADARASEIVDEDSGERYRVEDVADPHNGVLTLGADRLT